MAAVNMEEVFMAKVLVADDYDYIRNLLTQVISNLGHEVVAAADGVEGLAKIMAEEIDVAVVDENMGGGDKDGSRMMILAKEAGRPLKRVIATSDQFQTRMGDEQWETQIREKWGVTWLVFLPKAFKIDELSFMIEQLLALPV